MPEEIEVVSSITQVQDTRLAVIESKIESVLNSSFKEIGGLLQEVRDQKLYLPKYHNFEEYTQARWNFSRIRAHQLIEGAAVSEKLLTIVNIPNEAVAREILKNPEPQQMKIAKAAVKLAKQVKSPLTAKIVKQAAEKLGVEPVNHHKGGLYEQMMKAKELQTKPVKSPQEIAEIPSGPLTTDESARCNRLIEDCYAANKVHWNNPPPPSPRSIIDTIIQALQ